MRALAIVLAPVALAVVDPAFAQDHSGHGAHMPAEAKAPADPHAGHNMDMSSDMTITAPSGAQSGPEHAADLYHDPSVMAQARAQLLVENGGMRASVFYIDRLEATFNDDHEGYAWNLQGWHGGDINRFWWKSEGGGVFDDEVERAELQLLYSRAVTPYFDIQTGVRQTYRPEGDRTDLVLAVQGLAPYLFEVSAEAFVSNEGEVSARAEAEYDVRLTQRLILQPRAELTLSADDIPEFEVASGFTDVELGARLRYEIRRNFAPYVGVEWEGALGDTRDLVEANGGDPDATRFVVGLHAFF